jgi:hypothetical protein
MIFIDRTDGQEYAGSTGGTMSGDGDISAMIEGTSYSGHWIYSASGGGYSLGTASAYSGGTSAFGTGTALGVSAQGNGLINMRSASGQFMRCVFNFNTLSNRGIGECLRNDGRPYDLRIKR